MTREKLLAALSTCNDDELQYATHAVQMLRARTSAVELARDAADAETDRGEHQAAMTVIEHRLAGNSEFDLPLPRRQTEPSQR